MRLQEAPQPKFVLVAALLFLTAVSAHIRISRPNPGLFIHYRTLCDVEDQGTLQGFEELPGLLNIAFASWFGIFFSIGRLGIPHESAPLLPFSPRSDLSERGPPRAIHF
jgi:hypothetical protein